MVSLLHTLLRAKYIILGTFLVSATCVVILLALKPDKYEAHMSFLVRNERADLLVSTDPQQNSVQHGDITEEDINSEVELLESSELLKGVVEACGLDAEYLNASGTNKPAAIEKATLKLSKNLVITPVRKSALITVGYTSKDRNESVRVLDELTREYLAKHADLHTAGKAATFFKQQSVAMEDQLQKKQKERAAELQATGYAALPEKRETNEKLMENTQAELDAVTVALADTSSQVAQVMSERAAAQPRLVTEDRVSANPYSVQSLNTMLADYENRKTHLETMYRPGDALLVEVEQQIANTQAALKAAKEISSEDKTTDVNPVWVNLNSKLNELRQQQAGQMSRKAELKRQLRRERDDIGKFERANINGGELEREIGELDASVKLYENKANAAEIAENLDTKISNIAVASPPIVPVLPAPSPFNYLTGMLFAVFLSLGVGMLSTMGSDKLYGAAAVESELGIPVLTSFD